MAAKKYYAVLKGKTPGVYETWEACKAQVHGFSGAVYKSFPTREEALAFLGADAALSEKADSMGESASARQKSDGASKRAELSEKANDTDGRGAARRKADFADGSAVLPSAYAFVDGSYHASDGRYGYGGFLVHPGGREILQGSGTDAEMASMRNVAGEVLGSMAAIQKALELGLSELTIYYDYMGIEMWATGAWKRNKAGTIAYYNYVASVKERIRLHFVKVKGHSGVEGNEEADRLAKEAAGVKI